MKSVLFAALAAALSFASGCCCCCDCRCGRGTRYMSGSGGSRVVSEMGSAELGGALGAELEK